MRSSTPRSSLLCLILLVIAAHLHGQHVIEGSLTDAQTGEPIFNANIVVLPMEIGTSSDRDGYFRITGPMTLPVTLSISHIGYEPYEEEIHILTKLTIQLMPITLQLGPVDVTETKLPGQYDVTSSTNTMSSGELAIRGVQDLQEVTRSISSVRIEGQSSGIQTISIRGANPNETPVYLDGIKINDTFTNVADLSFLNVNEVEELEIIKGAASLPYETGAFGGVVNIYTRVPTTTEVALSTAHDLVNSANQTQTGNVYVVRDRLAASYQFSQRAREYFAYINSQNGFHSGSLRWGFEDGGLNLKYFNQFTETINEFEESSSTSDDNQLVSLRYTGKLPALGEGWHLEYAYREDQHASSFWSINPTFPTYEQTPQGIQSSIEGSRFFEKGAFEGLLKAEHAEQKFLGPSRYSKPPTFYRESDLDLDRITTSYVGIAKYTIESPYSGMQELQVELGMRYDDMYTAYDFLMDIYTYSPGAIEPNVRSESEAYEKQDYFLSKRVGFKSNGQLKHAAYALFYGQGFNSRNPTLQDYFFHKTNDVILYNQRELDHETVNTVDFELELAYTVEDITNPFERIDVNLGYFKNAYVSKLNYIYTPAQPPVPYNTINAMIKGYEIDVQAETRSGYGVYSAGGTMLKMDHAEVFAGKPTYRYVLGYTLRYSDFNINTSYWSEGQQYLPDGSIQLYDGRSNLDLTVSYFRSFDRFRLNASYGFKNLLSREETLDELERFDTYYALSYYDQFQQVLSLKITLK